jgi:hypothetical protein
MSELTEVCLGIYSTKLILKYIYQLHITLLTIKNSVVTTNYIEIVRQLQLNFVFRIYYSLPHVSAAQSIFR